MDPLLHHKMHEVTPVLLFQGLRGDHRPPPLLLGLLRPACGSFHSHGVPPNRWMYNGKFQLQWMIWGSQEGPPIPGNPNFRAFLCFPFTASCLSLSFFLNFKCYRTRSQPRRSYHLLSLPSDSHPGKHLITSAPHPRLHGSGFSLFT